MVKPLIPKQTRLTKKGDIISVVAWEVPKSKDYPEGINYAFALIHKNKRVLGYDYKRFMKEIKEFVGDKDED